MGPTPLAYFAAHHLGCGSCVAVSGSHNPPEYNGLKMVVGGNALYGEEIQDLRKGIERRDFASGKGKKTTADVLDAYVERIAGDVKLARKFHVAIDCGNGVAGMLAPRLYRRLGCEVTELFCEVDGTFPNHHPDPAQPENLVTLIETLRTTSAELGLAFDGDGDRLGVVTKDGEIIFADRQLMLLAKDVLSRNPGAEIIYDVKSTRLLPLYIERHGGRPMIWKTGHSLIKAKLKETGALLAGEMSGHTFFKERWYGFDDALYGGARLLEVLSKEPDANRALKSLPNAPSTPEIHWLLEEGEPHAMVAKLQRQASKPFPGAERVVTIDGVRVEYADGFGLARASNTTPTIVMRFEADNPAALERIKRDFRSALQPLKPDAPLPY
jgi:phosphomannomutase/phosphoglucomutase